MIVEVEDATIQWDAMVHHLLGGGNFTAAVIRAMMEPQVVRVVAHKEGQVG